MEKPQ